MDSNISISPFFGRHGSVIDRKYIIESVVGEGDFGIVYKVHPYNSDHVFALKVVRLWDAPPERALRVVNRFDIDYQAGEIASEYLVRSLDRGFVNGNPYIVTDYCRRGNINESIGTNGFDIKVAALQILLGLKALHARSKVHGDLKPRNVLMGDDGRTVLCDFGIIGSCNRSLANRGLRNLDPDRFAAYRYMAPETLTGNSAMMAVLPTADIYSFGVTMYELLTGYLPFGHLDEAAEIGDYMERAFAGDWDRRRLSYSPNLRCWLPVLEGCLNPDHERRLKTVDQVIELMPLEHDATPPAIAPQPETPAAELTGYCLKVLCGEQFGDSFYIDRMIEHSGRGVITVGRNDHDVTNFVGIRERNSCYVSRRQCTLEYDFDNDAWWVRDGQWDVKAPGHWRPSRNGTYTEAGRVDTLGTKLAVGDVITLGDVKLRLERY